MICLGFFLSRSGDERKAKVERRKWEGSGTVLLSLRHCTVMVVNEVESLRVMCRVLWQKGNPELDFIYVQNKDSDVQQASDHSE